MPNHELKERILERYGLIGSQAAIFGSYLAFFGLVTSPLEAARHYIAARRAAQALHSDASNVADDFQKVFAEETAIIEYDRELEPQE